MIDLDEVQKLLDGVTPGPWWSDDRPDGAIIWTSGENRVCFMAHSNGLNPERDIANARFIAAARELVPALLARAEAAERELDALKEHINATR